MTDTIEALRSDFEKAMAQNYPMMAISVGDVQDILAALEAYAAIPVDRNAILAQAVEAVVERLQFRSCTCCGPAVEAIRALSAPVAAINERKP